MEDREHLIEIIERAKGKVKIGVYTLEYAKAYCFGYIDAVVEHDELYDELANKIDELD